MQKIIKNFLKSINGKISDKNQGFIYKIPSNQDVAKINLYPREIEIINDYINEQIIYTNYVKSTPDDVVIANLGMIVNIMYNEIKNLNSEIEIDTIFDSNYYQKYMRVFFENNINKAKRFMGKRIQITLNRYGTPDDYFDNRVAFHLDSSLKLLIEYKQLHLYDYYDIFINLRGSFFLDHYNGDGVLSNDAKDDIVKNEICYTMDVFITCMCISKILYIADRVNNLTPDSELYLMMRKMVVGINNKDLIIKKIEPIYRELYNKDLGNLKTDYLITLFLEFLYNRVNEDLKNINYKIYVGKGDILTIINNLIMENSLLKNRIDIENYIIKELSMYQNYNIEDFVNLVSNMKFWNQEYSDLYLKNRALVEKERFLSGDFELEKQELGEKYNLNNITTGDQFELYLENLFKELGYKVKHSGKAGDQGADLILKFDDMVYVVQAKFYSNKLDNTPIQEVVAAIKYYNANQGVVITNSSYTKGAEKLAKANNVILIDGNELKNLVVLVFENKNEDVFKKYIS